MRFLSAVDWKAMLVPDTPLLEIAVRGTLVYLSLFLLLRVILKRESQGLGVTDLLVVVLIADAAQNAMADDYRSIPDGILLVAVILFWAWFLDWVSFRSPRLDRLLKPQKLPLVRDGRRLRKNMAKELITEEELDSQLRLQGIEDVARVKVAYMEADGGISVITTDGSTEARLQDRSAPR